MCAIYSTAIPSRDSDSCFPSLTNLTVSVDVTHHIYLLKGTKPCFSKQVLPKMTSLSPTDRLDCFQMPCQFYIQLRIFLIVSGMTAENKGCKNYILAV